MIPLSADEHVECTTRKHWFILLRDTIGIIVIAILPFVAYPFFADAVFLSEILSTGNITPPSIETPWLVFLSSVWLALWWVKLFGAWTDYYLDVWIITNRRIIDIEQYGFFSREMASFRIERIQDVTIEVHGFIPTLLNFGSIHVQTAGIAQEFRIDGIPNPEQMKQTILERYAARMEELKESERSTDAT